MIVKVSTITVCLWALISSHGLLQSKKIVFHSIVEFEYRTVANGIVELSWIGSFFLRTQHCLYDCQSSLSWSKKACRDWLSFCLRKDGSKNSTLSPALFISVNYTPSIHQLAVYLTKAVPIQRFLHFWNKLTVLTRPLSLQEEGGGVWINRVIHINKVLILAIFRFWSLYSIRPCVQIVSLIHSLYIAHFYGKHNTITNLLQLFPLFSSPFFLFISLKAFFFFVKFFELGF